MTDTELAQCATCSAVLAPWEAAGCACNGPTRQTIREVLYSIACTATQPLHVRDFVRIAERDHGLPFGAPTANVYLSTDYRFCWAGRGLYGLYRHGPLPGPRKLEPATRILLMAADAPLSHEVIDFCLKRLGYRYNLLSLRNAIDRSSHIVWEHGLLRHPRGEAAELELRSQISIVPPRHRTPWTALHANIRANVLMIRKDLLVRYTALSSLGRFGLDWDPDLPQ